MLNCAEAENERILLYPSIKNVPLEGQEKYEPHVTLCSGESSREFQGNDVFLKLSVCLCKAAQK